MSVAPADRVRLNFPAARRLRRKWEFDQLYARGKRLGNNHFGITVHPNDLGLARLGLAVASKPFGGSVPRNRIRRLIRESFRLRQHELPAVEDTEAPDRLEGVIRAGRMKAAFGTEQRAQGPLVEADQT